MKFHTKSKVRNKYNYNKIIIINSKLIIIELLKSETWLSSKFAIIIFIDLNILFNIKTLTLIDVQALIVISLLELIK